MAFMTVNLFSQTLMRTVPVNVILPADKMTPPGEPERGDKPFKTLYLLHGIFGNYTDWVNGTRIQRYAEENDLCVVMPSGDNWFYLDNEKSFNRYGEFIGRELVELTRKMFPLSRKREDTYIGGLSMGGFGALRNGIKYHETYGAVIALSSALIVDSLPQWTNESPTPIGNRDYAEAIFGDLEKVAKSDKSPRRLVKELKKQGVELPEIYMACGEDDFLLKANQTFVDYLMAHDVDVTFEVGPGAHDWDFWDTYIKKGIEWLPLEKTVQGINSGNVGNSNG